ncbi:MAG: Na(+)/H(+) antiporter subunit D, partial [Motiliproteus sp.]|nr:Na(+)/H(+) antiporter subunit D [Motiliproteus sp.]
MFELIPSLPLFVAAVMVGFCRGWLRAAVMLLAPVVGAYMLFNLAEGTTVSFELMGMSLTPVRVDRLSLLFGYLFHLAAFIGVIYALHIKDRLQDCSALFYAASAVGAVF